MKISKKTLATIFLGLAAVIGVVGIFCFFGATVKATESGITFSGPTMFAFMFGGNWTFLGQAYKIELKAGMTVLFVIEMLILLLSVVLIAGGISKKLKDNSVICIATIIALLTLVALIMSFCSKGLTETTGDWKLAAGPISYSVLGIVGIISNVTGIILYKKA